MSEEFHERGANQIQKAAESDTATVTLATGSGSVTVNFDRNFVDTTYAVTATLGGGIDGDASYNNKTQSSVDIVVANSGAADGDYEVSWRAVGDQGR